MRKDADWKGRIRQRIRWDAWWKLSTWRREWGRWCFRTNYAGDTLEQWWEWETP